MQIKSIKLQNVRNIDFASINFLNKNQFLVGCNAQGKTNLIESIGFISALRSFRTQEVSNLIKKGVKEAQIVFQLEHEVMGESEVLIKIHTNTKEVFLEGEKLNRLSDLIGLFPTVTISSQDIQLLRSSPQHRRRFIDVLLSTLNKDYLQLLKRHHRILKNRNNLLRNEKFSEESLNSFDKLLVPDACRIIQLRRETITALEIIFKKIYKEISQRDEVPQLIYEPNIKIESEEDYYRLLLNNRDRDRIMKSTQRGLHRDDLLIQLDSQRAKDHSSEGQQKNLVIALKLAQMKFYSDKLDIKPVLLADDVLGELDEARRDGFWNFLHFDNQVIATGVDLPEEKYVSNWGLLKVCSGAFHALN